MESRTVVVTLSLGGTCGHSLIREEDTIRSSPEMLDTPFDALAKLCELCPSSVVSGADGGHGGWKVKRRGWDPIHIAKGSHYSAFGAYPHSLRDLNNLIGSPS